MIAGSIDGAFPHDAIISLFSEFGRIPMLYVKGAVRYAGQFIHSKLLHVA